MAIVAIKIGENEPDTYVRFNNVSKHCDIVDVFSADGSLGTQADKHFLILNIDMSHLDAKQFSDLRGRISKQWLENEGMVICNNCSHTFSDPRREIETCPECGSEDLDDYETMLAKRLYCIDLSLVAFLSPETKDKIAGQTTTKRSIKPAVYQFIADREVELGEKPSKGEVAAYKDQLEENFDMMTINRFDIVVPFDTFTTIVVNKETGQTLAEELK